ncbi:MAG TPA: hypothetical protein VEI50_15240 [Nitrospiraceae bacterium]|nr:hypothetical protein [Nitrospiraceae bacterium]
MNEVHEMSSSGLAGRLVAIGVIVLTIGSPNLGAASSKTIDTTIIQIYGRMCEYHREDVEGALRSFSVVQQVEFLNDHGTVLVHYQSGSKTPEQFADAVEQTLAAGWGCSARVDRGQSHVRTIHEEERP